MARIYESVSQLVGHTPLLALQNFGKDLPAALLAKLEGMNPAGSVKDRVALAMILDGEKTGRLAPGGTIIEPTSGNTGIGLAAIGVPRGYRVIIVMPDSMSAERQLLMAAYGAELVLTPGALGMQGAIDKANALAWEIPGSMIPGQFENPANPAVHAVTTGPEIWEDTDGAVDIFVSGVGTGGSLTGIGAYLKQKNPRIQVVAVEPANSPLLSKGMAGSHGLQGIGANFVPEVLDRTVYDEVFPVTEEQAYSAGRRLGKTEGFLAGISAGAALYAAEQIALRPENAGKTIVVLLPDTGDRYLSTQLFQE